MRLRILCCEVFYREVCRLIADSPNTSDVEFLPRGHLEVCPVAGAEERKSQSPGLVAFRCRHLQSPILVLSILLVHLPRCAEHVAATASLIRKQDRR